MRKIELAPIQDFESDYNIVEREILRAMMDEVYEPIWKMVYQYIGNKSIYRYINSIEDLVAAIRSGRISHSKGKFTGRMTSAVSRELKKLGAEWDRKQGCWKIPLSSLPVDIRTSIRESERRALDTLKRIDDKLMQILPDDIAKRVDMEKMFDHAMFRVDKKFESQIRKITVAPKLTADGRRRLASEYSKNMQITIQEWAQYEIKQLRKTVEERANEGLRYEDLADSIRRRYGVTKQKAKFLARQETGLYMAKFKELRYADAGIKKYKWRTVAGTPAHPVRPMHKKLDGTIQRFDQPPIVNEKGDRKNPREDYGCRCTAIPIVEFV